MQFRVSRSVIREAMRTVSGVGMTHSRQGRGTRVLDEGSWNEFSPDILQARVESGTTGKFLLEFIELRTLLESQVAGLAAERANRAQLDAIYGNLVAMERAPHDIEAFIDADLQFHNSIVAATGNTMIVRLFDLLQPMLRVARHGGHHPGDANESRDHGVDSIEHRKVFDCINARDPRGANEAMIEHLQWVARRDVGEPL